MSFGLGRLDIKGHIFFLISINITVLDGYFVRRIGRDGPDRLGRFTFTIQDAIRFNGTDLNKGGILQRIDTIEVILFYCIIPYHLVNFRFFYFNSDVGNGDETPF